MPTNPPLHFRSIWISDVHLGYKGCQAELLLDFLQSTHCKHFFMVGDIIDVWSLTRNFYWPQAHNNFIRTILGKAKHGTNVVYVPGNHDEVFREYDGMVFGNVAIRAEHVHETADGRRLLLLHGDEFDSIVRCHPFIAHLGSHCYSWLLGINRWVNFIRRRLGFPYWSLANCLKQRVKNAVSYISGFEDAVAHAAARRGVDGLVCGHIHRAEMREIHGVMYCNDGDWVESCTTLVEHLDGRLELIDWSEYVLRRDQEQEVRTRRAA